MGEIGDALPNFNDELLLRFRETKISQIDDYLDSIFKESMKLFGGRLVYVGYTTLGPEERMEYILSNPIINKSIDIQKSDFKLLRFEFRFEGVVHYLHVHVPFMKYGCVVLSDTEYYPLLPIVERGGLHRTRDSIIIKVMRAPLTFRRQDAYVIETTTGEKYLERILTIKIHQGSRKGRKLDRTPLILYHLVKYGLEKTLEYYQFAPGELQFTTMPANDTDSGYSYIRIRDDLFMRVPTSVLQTDMYKRRVIVSLLRIFEDYKRFTLGDLLDPKAFYFKVALGKYTYPSNNKPELLLTNANAHLATTDTLLDPPAQFQLATIDIHATDIYDLIYKVFYNMDRWIISYKPTNLYDKKIGSLDQIMATLVREINNKQFNIINSNVGLNQDTVTKFMRQASKHSGWFTGCSVFRANPTFYSDNLLLSILAKRFRSLENTETASVKGGKRKAKGKKIPVGLLKAHPSQLVVESILSIPPSSQLLGSHVVQIAWSLNVNCWKSLIA